MPPQSHMDQPYPERHRFAQPQARPGSEPGSAARRSPLSRRSVLRGGAGAVGLAAAAGVGAVVAAKRQPAQETVKSASLAEPPSDPSAGPIVVYIADASTGQFDIFAGTGQVRMHNPDLVGQLLANLKQA